MSVDGGVDGGTDPVVRERPDRRFVQEQVGHRQESSTAIYTHVSGDFMNTMLRRVLGPALDNDADPGREGGP